MKLPQFYLRDLFWLIAVVALVLGWGADGFNKDRIAKERDIVVFKAFILEQLLKDRGVTIEVPRAGTLIITEKGLTQEMNYKW